MKAEGESGGIKALSSALAPTLFDDLSLTL